MNLQEPFGQEPALLGWLLILLVVIIALPSVLPSSATALGE